MALVAGLLVLPFHHGEATAFSPYALAVLLAMGSVWTLARHRSIALAGALQGAAVATHYLALLAAPALLILRPAGQRPKYRDGLVWALAACAAFLVSNPQALLFPAEAMATLGHRAREAGAFLAGDDLSLAARVGRWYYWVLLGRAPIGWMATVGAIVAFRRRHEAPAPWHLVLVALAGLGLLSLPATHFDRYLMFLYPLLAVVAAGAIPTPGAGIFRHGLMGVLVLACLVSGGIDAWGFRGSSAVFNQPFAEMTAWARAATVPGDRIVLRMPWAGDMQRALQETATVRIKPQIAAAVKETLEREAGVPVSWGKLADRNLSPIGTGRTWLYEAEWRKPEEGQRIRPAGTGMWWSGGLKHHAHLMEDAESEDTPKSPLPSDTGRTPPAPGPRD